MCQSISNSSKLRREIISLVKLNPKIEQHAGEDAFVEKINQVIFKIVDIACSVLQGSQQTSERDAEFTAVLLEIEETRNLSGLSSKEEYITRDLERHLQQIRLICLDPSLPGDLQNEKIPLPTYSHLTETVLLANGQLMAESFRLFLESFGIQAILGRESAGVVYGLTVGPLGEVDIKVTPGNATDARILLDAMQKGYFALEDEPVESESILSDSADAEIDEEDISDDF
ncbi:MAG: hypothetical protein LLG42_01935 [Chloroflexi bacterium]|nr:hypothetical protein [Chloroflexota bacterium]